MAMLSISKELLARLEALAERENQNVTRIAESILANGVENYSADIDTETIENPSLGLIGIITEEETQLTDLSTSVREIIRDQFSKSDGKVNS